MGKAQVLVLEGLNREGLASPAGRDDRAEIGGGNEQTAHVVPLDRPVRIRSYPLPCADIERLPTPAADDVQRFLVDVLEEVDRLPVATAITADVPPSLVALLVRQADAESGNGRDTDAADEPVRRAADAPFSVREVLLRQRVEFVERQHIGVDRI